MLFAIVTKLVLALNEDNDCSDSFQIDQEFCKDRSIDCFAMVGVAVVLKEPP